MKFERWITPLGSFVLLVSAIVHTSGYGRLVHRIDAGAMVAPPLDGLLKAFWLLFSVELFFLGAIAFLGRSLKHGGRIVLLCGACTGVSALVMLRFLGAFPGVYLLAAATLLLVLGGTLQAKEPG
jgi:hypothetical protein